MLELCARQLSRKMLIVKLSIMPPLPELIDRDDPAIGGFFALNGGALGNNLQSIYYFAPDSLNWIPLSGGYSQFLQWAFSGKLDQFYDWIHWQEWDQDVRALSSDRCYAFYPFLWTADGKVGRRTRAEIPIDEAWHLHMDLQAQLKHQ